MSPEAPDEFLLGAVRRGEMEKVLEVAKDYLNWQSPYWNTFHHPEHLAGWLLTNFRCPYCGTDLLEQHVPSHTAHTDHLLPQKKYPELRDHSMMNAVASCDVCNCMKGDYDPNEEDPLYFGGELTYEMRQVLIARTREKLSSKPRVAPNRELNIERIRSAAAQAREKLA